MTAKELKGIPQSASKDKKPLSPKAPAKEAQTQKDPAKKSLEKQDMAKKASASKDARGQASKKPKGEMRERPNLKAQAPLEAEFSVDLSVTIGSVKLKNPVIAASGVFGYGLEFEDFCPPDFLGAVISKGLSLEPWPGNPGPRVAEAAGGLLNAIGLQNIGIKAFLNGPLLELKRAKAIVGANVIGRTAEEYVEAARILADSEVDFLELNISCPNLSSEGGLSFGADPDAAGSLTEAVVKAAGAAKPLSVKLPPLTSDISKLARTVESAGAEAISLINTLPGLAIDLKTRKPLLGHVTGGLSGPPIKPLALRQVYLASQAVKIPVVGLGGVMTPNDALEFMIAGAAAIQMGTAILVDPVSPLEAIVEMKSWLINNKIARISDMVGTLKL